MKKDEPKKELALKEVLKFIWNIVNEDTLRKIKIVVDARLTMLREFDDVFDLV